MATLKAGGFRGLRKSEKSKSDGQGPDRYKILTKTGPVLLESAATVEDIRQSFLKKTRNFIFERKFY